MNRAPGSVWMLRLPTDDKPNAVVRTTEGDRILIAYAEGRSGRESVFTISRSDARLLAKRINQCLDATVKK